MCLCVWLLAVKQVVSVTHFYMTHPNKTCILINPEQAQRESQGVNPSVSSSMTHRPTNFVLFQSVPQTNQLPWFYHQYNRGCHAFFQKNPQWHRCSL